jgi:hypothetical protein
MRKTYIKGREFYSRRKISCVIFVMYACLCGGADLARSAVFEQLESGVIQPIGGGVLSGTSSDHPNTIEDDGAGADQAPVASPLLASASSSAVIFDSPYKLQKSIAALPLLSRKPPAELSLEQKRMAGMAADVARSFSRHPGVIRAQLDQATFVNLFLAMIRRESNFNPRAISRAGAKGLGQLMPGTARELGVCDVFSPQDNLVGSVAYLTAMLEQFGTPAMALAAYNAGPSAVARYGRIPPYRETQRYVADIMYAAAQAPQHPHLQSAVDVLSSSANELQLQASERLNIETTMDRFVSQTKCSDHGLRDTLVAEQ